MLKTRKFIAEAKNCYKTVQNLQKKKKTFQ